MTGPACGNNPNYRMSDGDRQAVDSFRAYLAARAALRDRIAAALYAHDHPSHVVPMNETGMEAAYQESADAVLAALPATTDQTAEPSLSPDYSHEACGFHWHGRDGMDIPIRDGQPVCPRCELAKVTRLLEHTSKRREEVGVECKRRGKRVLEQSEQILTLERQIDEVRRQLGAEILRAGQAEAGLRRMADETPAAETPWPIVTDFSIEVWEGDTWVGVTYKRKTIEEARERRDSFRRRFPEERLRIVRWDETPTVVEADPEPAAGARQDGAQP